MKYFNRVLTTTATTIGPTGHTHVKDPKDERFIIECPTCEPFLHPTQWSTRPGDIEKTWDEKEREAEIKKEKMDSTIDRLADVISNRTTAQPNTAELLKQLTTDKEAMAVLAEMFQASKPKRRTRKATDGTTGE